MVFRYRCRSGFEAIEDTIIVQYQIAMVLKPIAILFIKLCMRDYKYTSDLNHQYSFYLYHIETIYK